jgi:hypothetical protein
MASYDDTTAPRLDPAELVLDSIGFVAAKVFTGRALEAELEDATCDCGTVVGSSGLYLTHAAGGHPDCTAIHEPDWRTLGDEGHPQQELDRLAAVALAALLDAELAETVADLTGEAMYDTLVTLRDRLGAPHDHGALARRLAFDGEFDTAA